MRPFLLHICKMKRTLFAIMLLLAFSACNNQQLTVAKIFERRHESGNRLLIKFRYAVDSKEYIDSATIENTPLEGDSIAVKYEKSSPGKATPQLEK
jgi:hypothetical protein